MGNLEKGKNLPTVEETNSSGSLNVESAEGSELISREEITDSPFVIITTENGSFGCMGKYRITEIGSKAEIKKELKKITWNRIVQVILLLQDDDVVLKKITKNEN